MNAMKTTVLELVDEVNCKFHNLDIITRKKLVAEVSYFLPYARHTPSFKLGRWDGKVKYCDIGARSYINLLDRLLPIVQDQGYEVELADKRQPTQFTFEKVAADSYSDGFWPAGHVCAGDPIILRDYQVEIVNEFLANTQGVQCISTGAGKTLVTAILSHKVEKYGRSIVIVPSKQLVTQTEADYKNLGLDVGVFFGDRKEYFRQHTICTWQSLEALNKKSKDFDPDITLSDFIEDVQCIIVDEAHGAKADALKKLMTTTFSNVPLRWGMTGTIPEDEYEAIALYASIGPLLHSVTAKELQDKGVLSNLHVHVQQLKDPVRVFSNYQAELAWLSSDKIRIEWLAEHIIEQAKTGNTLVLVQRKKTGQMLQSFIPNSVYIDGSVKVKARQEEYDEVRTSAGKVIIATAGVAAVGIDVPRIFNLYLFEPGKSFVRVIQSIGRGIRMAKDKDYVNVFDITSNCKYSKRHLTKRKKFYKDAQYPYSIKKVDYI
jgi:superfamily II DNA or RNA helicase